MLFNSLEFIYVFLPLAMIVYQLSARFGSTAAASATTIISLVFYSWWLPHHLPILLTSILVNYAFRTLIVRNRSVYILATGIAANLAVLGYYKYSLFFVEIWGGLTGREYNYILPVLPLAISFFSFQQIAFLVDCYRTEHQPISLRRYSFCVTFFPHLIAGPLVHYYDIADQAKRLSPITWERLRIGLQFFAIGLFKKVVIADSLSPLADHAFGAAAHGSPVHFADAWTAALAYTLYIYFDFSGYSDMAIGLGRIFGIRLPWNFDSPYKSTSPTEFWRRWHMTLSGFLRDYLYIPLGGNRHGRLRQYFNLMITMLLAGLWHGAGWTFVFWGGYHGLLLVLNRWASQAGLSMPDSPAGRNGARLGTFLLIIIGWVLFRAPDLDVAGSFYAAMVGVGGIGSMSMFNANVIPLFAVLLAWVFLLPNAQQMLGEVEPDTARSGPLEGELMTWLAWRPNLYWVAGFTTASVLALSYVGGSTKFLYFQF